MMLNIKGHSSALSSLVCVCVRAEEGQGCDSEATADGGTLLAWLCRSFTQKPLQYIRIYMRLLFLVHYIIIIFRFK